MKYVHIVQFHSITGGGVGSVITDLSQEMAKSCDQIYVVSLFKDEKIDFNEEIRWGKNNNINVEIIQKNNMNKISVLMELRKYIKKLSREDEVCLFLHLKWGVLAGVIGSAGIKKIHRIEVYHSGYMRYKLQAFFCKPFIHHYISVSKEAKMQLIKWFHVRSDKITVVYNGVDIEKIRKIAESTKSSLEYDNTISLISVGRLSFEKGFLTPITSYSTLKKENALGNTTYTMVGEGPQMDEARKISNGFIKFTGKIDRDDVYKVIAQSDIVILPSLWEGNSILLLEVLAIGKAVIVSDIPSFREVLHFEPLNKNEKIRIEQFGIVFQKDNIDSCKYALECISTIDYSILQKMALFSKSISDSFSIKTQAIKYFNIVDDSQVIKK